MSTGLHKDLAVTELHKIQSLEFADATARNAFSAVAADVGRVCQQLDTAAFYVLEDDSPLTWAGPLGSGGVPTSRTLTAGAGLTGGGDLSADRTFDVVANADGSITVNANDIQVGVLASDAQHGTRGGGTQHADATITVSGFMSGADKTKLDGVATGATNTPLSSTNPVNVTKAAASAGVAADASRQDHKHDVTTAAAGAITPGDAAAEGTATSLARSDHQHSIAAFGTGAGTFAQGNDSRFVTNGDSHDHNGGDGAQIDHTTLSNIGTNAHTAIDTHIAAASPHSGHATTSHAPTHIRGGSDEVDGDKLDIDWNPTNYTPATTPTEVTHVDELTAHLYGIDQALAATGPYGSEYQQASSESESSTTGDLNYHQKVRLTTTTVPAGDYLVQWYCEWAADGDDTIVKFKVELDDTTVLAEIKPRDKGKYVDGVFHFWSGSKVHTLTNASHTLDFDYGHEEADNRIVYIRRARIILWRVS